MVGYGLIKNLDRIMELHIPNLMVGVRSGSVRRHDFTHITIYYNEEDDSQLTHDKNR